MDMYSKSMVKVALVGLLSVCAGCATWDSMDRQEKGTATGAAGGALVGAAVGGPVGAVVGAGVGGYAGHYETEPGGIAAAPNGNVAMNDANSRGAVYAANGDVVSDAQRALNERGFNAGAVDGVWGPNTQQAVVAFQRSDGLPATGNLDDRTLNALGVR